MRKIGFAGLILGVVLFQGTWAWTTELKIHVFNVGQGDSFLIDSPSGIKILIDAGNNGKGNGVVLPYLNSLGIISLHYIFASHYHSDHIGGLDEVVSGLGGSSSIIYAAYDRGGSYSSQTFTDYVNAIGAKRGTISAGHFIDLGDGVNISCVASGGSVPSGRVYTGTDENTLSVVLVLSYNHFQMYFGGDSTSTVEPYIAPFAGNVDIYKVSHHGSGTSSSQQLLSTIKPEVSIIPVGDGNPYDHPDPGTITRLVGNNSYIYQTETGFAVPPSGKGEIANGNFIIKTDGYSYTISGATLTTTTRLTDEGASSDLVGTWDNQGVYFRSTSSGIWTTLATPAEMIACGDLYGDGIDDLVGVWSGQAGVWAKNSANCNWAFLGSTPRHIATGDMNGDGRVDLLGTWDGQGVFYRDSISATWNQMATPATLITAGDLDGDSKADLIGIWPSQAGVWAKYSQTGNWSYLGSSPRDFAVGDMNGDGRVDLIGTWDGQGVFYKDSISGNWVMMATPADQVAAGDLDGDGMDDLIGIWAGQAGVWVKYSSTGQWAYIGSSARDITAGKMSGGIWSTGLDKPTPLNISSGGFRDGPSQLIKYDNFSAQGPGGNQFLFERGRDLVPRISKSAVTRIPGPGEPGFKYTLQKNISPVQNGVKQNEGKR